MKSLSEESGKTLAAQILQRTLARYIAIKNNFSFCSGVRLVASPDSVRRFLRAESGAKVKTFFETTKSFRKIFFQNLFVSLPTEEVFIEAGAKVEQISESPKNPESFFKTFSEPLRETFLSRSGCKVNALKYYFQIFRRFFCDIFRTLRTPR